MQAQIHMGVADWGKRAYLLRLGNVGPPGAAKARKQMAGEGIGGPKGLARKRKAEKVKTKSLQGGKKRQKDTSATDAEVHQEHLPLSRFRGQIQNSIVKTFLTVFVLKDRVLMLIDWVLAKATILSSAAILPNSAQSCPRHRRSEEDLLQNRRYTSRGMYQKGSGL